jgi:hypothetical protein
MNDRLSMLRAVIPAHAGIQGVAARTCAEAVVPSLLRDAVVGVKSTPPRSGQSAAPSP